MLAAVALALPTAALATFDEPGSSDPSQQLDDVLPILPYENVQRDDTPDDPDYDRAEPPENTATSMFEERFDLFGFASEKTRADVRYRDPAKPEYFNRGVVSGFNAAGGWKITRGLPGVSVAILDTGINWNNGGVRDKVALNQGELPLPQHANGTPAATYDLDGDGAFTVDDYTDDPRVSAATPTGQHLITAFENGDDGDGNGYVDDIAGWDFFDDDNDPADTSSYFAAENHGSGRTSEAVEKGNDSAGSIGVCPKCQYIPVRVWDTFVSDQNSFFMGVVYATDNGAEVIEGADGGLYHSAFAEQASQYAYDHGVAQVYSGDDLNTANHNYPAAYDHAMLIEGVVADAEGLGTELPEQEDDPGIREQLIELIGDAGLSTMLPLQTYFRNANTTQFGGKSSISMQGPTGSTNTGKAAGAAALVISAAREQDITLTPDETRELLEQTAEDITAPDTTGLGNPDPAQTGFDTHFGYGRANVGEAVGAAADGRIPPEASIDSPDWYAPVTGDSVAITGRARARGDDIDVYDGDFTWTLEYGLGLAPTTWEAVSSGVSGGTQVTDFGALPLDDIRDELAAREQLPTGHPDRDDSGGPTLNTTDPELDPFRGQFTVRLVVASEDGAVLPGMDRQVLTALPDGQDLRPGFPKRLGTGGEGPLRYGDIDGDNAQELIVPAQDGAVHAYRPNGSELSGWPVRTQTQFAARAHLESPALQELEPPLEPPRAPTVADLTGDGVPEVITTAGERIYVWGSGGELLPGWPVRPDPGRENCALSEQQKELKHPKCGFIASPALARLGGPDEPPSIVVPGLDGRLRAYERNGTPAPGFPVRLRDPDVPGEQSMTAESINNPAIGDLDGDGRDEIVVATNEVYGGDGGGGGDVSFGDALAAAGTTSRVYAVKASGRGPAGDADPFLPGWPIKPGGIIQNVLPLVGPGHDPALVRVDDEQQVVVSVTGGALALYGVDGTLTRELQQSGAPGEGALNLFESAAVGDIDGAGSPEVVKYQVDLGQAANLLLVGQNVPYSHRMGAFDPTSGATKPPFPVITDDYQFLSSSTVAKVADGTSNQVLTGTGLGLLHAYDGLTGLDTAGFPKVTGGWLFAPAAISDDERVAAITREGYLFEWDVPGAAECQSEWPSFRHDAQGTGNYDADGTAPAAPGNLTLVPLGGNSYRLTFVSPGDDGFCATAERYVADVNGVELDLGAPVAGGQTFTKDIQLEGGQRLVTVRAADGAEGEASNLGPPAVVVQQDAVAPPGPLPGGNGNGNGGGNGNGNGNGGGGGGPNVGSKPRLKLKLRFRAARTASGKRCARSRVRVTIRGADRGLAERATFRIGRRVLRDRKPPLSRVYRDRHRGASHIHRVRAGVRLGGGRLVRLEPALPRLRWPLSPPALVAFPHGRRDQSRARRTVWPRSRLTRRSAATRSPARWRVSSWACATRWTATRQIGAVVVRGAGGYFCAGGDRGTLAAAGADPAEPDSYTGLGDVYRSFQRVGELEPPTIAAVRGGAVGAGVNLAFATDLRSCRARRRSCRASCPSACIRAADTASCSVARVSARRRPRWPSSASGIDGARAAELGPGLGGAWRTRGGGPAAAALARGPAGRPGAGRRTARSLRTELGPPGLPWPAALELERASQMWSMRRKHLAGEGADDRLAVPGAPARSVLVLRLRSCSPAWARWWLSCSPARCPPPAGCATSGRAWAAPRPASGRRCSRCSTCSCRGGSCRAPPGCCSARPAARRWPSWGCSCWP